jgi:hypothetical protein
MGGVKRPKTEADNSAAVSSEAMNMMRCTSTPLRLHNVTHKNTETVLTLVIYIYIYIYIYITDFCPLEREFFEPELHDIQICITFFQ